MADRLPFSGEQYWNAISRNAFPGAKLYTYDSQSRTTLKATFTDAGAGTPHANPVIADANGLFAAVYGNGEYFIDIYNTDDTTLIYQEDEVFGSAPANVNQTVTVSLIADLRLVDTTAFQSAFVEGTTVIDDGGQGRFFFDSGSSAIDNGTTIIAPTVGTGRWLILNVETLAIGDDSVTADKMGFLAFMGSGSDGLVITNGTDTEHDLDITSGRVADSTKTEIMVLPSTMTKRIDAPWAEGTAQGGFPTGLTLIDDVNYRIMLIGKTDGTVDWGFDTSATAANLLADATDYTLFRRIGWARTFDSGASNFDIINYSISGKNEYTWDASSTDLSTSSPATTATNITLQAFPNTIAQIYTRLNVESTSVGDSAIDILTTDQPSASVIGLNGHILTEADTNFAIQTVVRSEIHVSSTSQVSYRTVDDTGGLSVIIRTVSWKDNLEDA